MACLTLFAPLAMATTQLMDAVDHEHGSTGQREESTERRSLHLSWVVVTDGGERRLSMEWSSTDAS